MLVSQILSSKPIGTVMTISPSSRVAEAAQLLAEKRIGAVIVSSGAGAIDGILSERDIVRGVAKSGSKCLDDTVADLMTQTVIACKPSDTVLSVLEKMTDGRFRHMPVVDGGMMVGVVSIGDAVKARIDEVEHENLALTDMIAGNA